MKNAKEEAMFTRLASLPPAAQDRFLHRALDEAIRMETPDPALLPPPQETLRPALPCRGCAGRC